MPRSKPKKTKPEPEAGEAGAATANAENVAEAVAEADPGSPAAVGALVDSPCLDRGAPLSFATVPARAGDRITALFAMCSAPGALVMFLQPSSIAAQPVPPIVQQPVASSDPVIVDLSTIEPGRYSLFWKFQAFSEPWQVVTEVEVNGVVRFRRYDTSNDGIPGTRVAVNLEVLP